jgi:hypothetical protein
MDPVRDRYGRAWVAHGRAFSADSGSSLVVVWVQTSRRGFMQDLAYIGLTILVFAALYLLVKGVERFER